MEEKAYTAMTFWVKSFS